MQLLVLVVVVLAGVLNCAAWPVTKIAAGGYHSLFLKGDGSLWGVGNRFEGQLGDGNFAFGLSQPVQIVPSNVVSIAGGLKHSLFLKADGGLWAMGENLDGQLGNGTYDRVNVPELIVTNDVTAMAGGMYYSVFLKSDGSL
jgi:alpha-tubulin suppressor-like RCC1 family protein